MLTYIGDLLIETRLFGRKLTAHGPTRSLQAEEPPYSSAYSACLVKESWEITLRVSLIAVVVVYRICIVDGLLSYVRLRT